MRKCVFILPLLLCASLLCSQAQQIAKKGFYLKAGSSNFIKVTPVEFPEINGYNAEQSVWHLSNDFTSIILDQSSSVTGSFGQGRRISIDPGYKFTDVIAFELGLHYYKSEGYTMMSKTILDPTRTVGLFSLQSKGEVEAFDIAPSLVLSFGSKNKIYPYTHVGLIIPMGGHLDITTTLNDPLGLSQTAQDNGLNHLLISKKDRIIPRPTVGFKAVLGGAYNLTKHISAYAEVEYRNISVSSKEKKTIAYSFSGVHISSEAVIVRTLEDLPLAERMSVSRKTITPDSNVKGYENYDPDKPADDNRSYINIGGLGLTMGIRVDL